MSTSPGLVCPKCRHPESRVTETRDAVIGPHAALRRRRHCKACNHRWWTYELSEEAVAPLESGGARGELRRALATLSEIRRAIIVYDRREDKEHAQS